MSEKLVNAETGLDITGLYPVRKWRDDGKEIGVTALQDRVAEEMPVAMIYNDISHAVMLATPDDLADFALGFSLCEGILREPSDLYGLDIVPQEKGVELRMEIASECFANLKERRRSMAGRTGCGLCGAESLEQALRIPEKVVASDLRFDYRAILRAQESIQKSQPLQALTGATHASAWVSPEGDIRMVREDVGRHNALDKLIGAIARAGDDRRGFVLTTSRASYEMVQKTVTAGIPMLVAISAPTGLAIRVAENSGIALVGFTRSHQHVVYAGAEKIIYGHFEEST
ncbi:formate dehydrogenase accessory sulfurtransferase FdhD [Methylovorus mays]|uniref:formate dehydrogenase accessory sulfurtransferase FdhD n=1 Tax=Methylovorus mays TaxID=184077 RepID=UPI001E477754|nr:formate dehydrogenase accessory sulfurtransferase FdhD [Methylovorus mays]MCB5206511.1 formate dehydrogenase accessory sulfurtransferase FdhD [Methylovorus mays]